MTARASSMLKFTQHGGSLNKLINKLPFELHLPGYNFCGPGTKLDKRLARGDKGINALDEACKEHDIAYSKFSDVSARHIADKILENKAFNQFKNKKSGLRERAMALGVSGAMKIKRKLGMGVKKRKYKPKKNKVCKGRGLTLSNAISRARKAIRGKKFKSLKASIKSAVNAIPNGYNNKMLSPVKRIIPVPKSGGFLPLVPLFAGLSALGALSGGAAGIAKAVNDAKAASQKLDEAKRHNKTMEAISLGKKGSGLYLKPYKKGYGLYLKPYPKNL